MKLERLKPLRFYIARENTDLLDLRAVCILSKLRLYFAKHIGKTLFSVTSLQLSMNSKFSYAFIDKITAFNEVYSVMCF